MNRIDRLLAILWILQYKKYVTVDFLAKKFELSTRTIYRDLRSLNEIGIPIVFEEDRGYYIMSGYFLPPLLFTIDEANSLILLQNLANKFADKSIAKSADSALNKIKSVLRKSDSDNSLGFSNKVEVYVDQEANQQNNYLTDITHSVTRQFSLRINYTDNNNNTTKREVEPIGIIFYTNQWHIIAWCSLREDYRDFKLNQINHLEVLPRKFHKEHSYTIQDYMKNF